MKIPNNMRPTPEPRRGIRSIWFWVKLIVVLIVVSISLLLIFNKQAMDVWVKTQSKPEVFMKATPKEIKENVVKSNKEGNFDGDTAVPVSAENIAKAEIENKAKPVLGGVAMPDIGINLPIMMDSGDYSMLTGAGPLLPNQVMGEGNYTLASHNMWTNESFYSKDLLFSPLMNAEIGHDIYLTDKDKVYRYKTIEVDKRVDPSEWDRATDAIPGTAVVTLITCAVDDEFRIMVRGELMEVLPFNEDTTEPFTKDLNQYWNK